MSIVSNTIKIYADTRGVGVCSGRDCRKRILWAEIVGSGKKMCFNDLELPALRTYQEEGTMRLVEVVDRDDNHWATCPNARDFSRRR